MDSLMKNKSGNFLISTVVKCVITVSYTHLDVYKRQVLLYVVSILHKYYQFNWFIGLDLLIIL